MDQIPMLFVVNQDSTFTTHDEEHVHIKGTGSVGLNMWQFFVHVFLNTRELEGPVVEKALYSQAVNVLWQLGGNKEHWLIVLLR